MFRRYMHVERLTDPIPERLRGLLHGVVTVFPKLDGANHCAWYDWDERRVMCASRRVVLADDNDSTGFYAYFDRHPEIAQICADHKGLVFYGEYLTPHTLKGYVDDAWGRWYVFDVWVATEDRYMTPSEYIPILESYKIDYIPPVAYLNSPSRAMLGQLVENNHYLMKDGAVGEGIVLKNYAYRNYRDEQVWGKMVTEDFRQTFGETWGVEKKKTDEEKFVLAILTEQFVSKELAKFTTDEGREWEDRMFPDLIKVLSREWESDYGPELMTFLSDHPDAQAKKVRKAFNQRAVRLVKSLT